MLAMDCLSFKVNQASEAATELKRVVMTRLFTRGLCGEASKETEIGLVPESWEVASLGAHHAVVSGGTPSRGNPVFWTDGTIPWAKTTEVDYCVINETEERITPQGLENSAAKLLPAGTLLMAMYGQGVTRGKVAILGIEAACNQACAAITPNDEVVLLRYLYHFLAWRYEAIRSLAHGGQQQNLNLEIVRDLPLAYPQTEGEQREIVAILDALDRKIALHRRKRAVLEELFQSLLHKLMIGEIRVADLDLSALASNTPENKQPLPGVPSEVA
jgi:type I restriction enzyme S subunit